MTEAVRRLSIAYLVECLANSLPRTANSLPPAIRTAFPTSSRTGSPAVDSYIKPE